MNKSKRHLLLILDGWGIAEDPSVSAVDAADTPFVDRLFDQYPHGVLRASGLGVGLPEGQMGNSEVHEGRIRRVDGAYGQVLRDAPAIEDEEKVTF